MSASSRSFSSNPAPCRFFPFHLRIHHPFRLNGMRNFASVVQGRKHPGKLFRTDAEQCSAAFYKTSNIYSMGQSLPVALLNGFKHTRRNFQPSSDIFNGISLLHTFFAQTGSQFFQCHDIPALKNFTINYTGRVNSSRQCLSQSKNVNPYD